MSSSPAIGSPAVPNPTVSGPIAATATPGDPSHDYPFFSTDFPIYSQGFIEQEFFLQGTANVYDAVASQQTTANVVSSGHAYKTRIVVRRPADPKRFNGTVVAEWYNVSAGVDVESDWLQGWQEFVRDGYAWVGVSVQRVGVNSLRSWNPDRYGSLDVTEGGTLNSDQLGWDIYSQALQAIKHPQGINPLGNLTVQRIIADGESQSAGRLATYYNAIHPLANVADGFIIHSTSTQFRTDLATPVFKLLNETDVVGNALRGRQGDSDVLRTWEATGTAHADFNFIGDSVVRGTPGVNPLGYRDTGAFQDPNACALPALTRTPWRYVYNAALVHMDNWIKNGTQPPHAPLIELTVGPGPNDATIVRDSFGIAKGGIRLAAVDVPTALNASDNSGPSFCRLWGTYQPFDAATLASLYPNHGTYANKVARVSDENVKDGFILRPDATATKTEAAQSTFGK